MSDAGPEDTPRRLMSTLRRRETLRLTRLTSALRETGDVQTKQASPSYDITKECLHYTNNTAS